MSKKLRPGELRFEVRPVVVSPRKTVYDVYDKTTGSRPVQNPELGKVKQAQTTEASAQIEADRLNQEHPT